MFGVQLPEVFGGIFVCCLTPTDSSLQDKYTLTCSVHSF